MDEHKDELFVRAGTTSREAYALDIGPERAGWGYSGLRVLELAPGGTHAFATGDSEWILLPLNGGCTVHVDDRTMELLGRESVFAGVTDFAYLPRDAHAQIASGAGGRFALAGASCERRLPARHGPAPEVPVERRGSGVSAREVRGFAAADVFACDRLIAVEVITPGRQLVLLPAPQARRARPWAGVGAGGDLLLRVRDPAGLRLPARLALAPRRRRRARRGPRR